MPLEGIDDIHGCDCLPLGVFSVGNGVPDDVLEEDLEYASGFFVDETADSLYASSSREPSDSGLGNTLDIIAKNLAMTFGASFSESLSSFASSGHDELSNGTERTKMVKSEQ